MTILYRVETNSSDDENAPDWRVQMYSYSLKLSKEKKVELEAYDRKFTEIQINAFDDVAQEHRYNVDSDNPTIVPLMMPAPPAPYVEPVCTCSEECREKWKWACKGECGCQKCHEDYQDALSMPEPNDCDCDECQCREPSESE